MIEDNWFYEGEFSPRDVDSKDWCPQARELMRAAEILDNESKIFVKNKVAPTNKIAADLAEWFVHKAQVLERHHQLWQYEQAHPESSLNVKMPVRTVEDAFSAALKTAREVIRTYDNKSHKSDKPWYARAFSKVFTRSGDRASQSS